MKGQARPRCGTCEAKDYTIELLRQQLTDANLRLSEAHAKLLSLVPEAMNRMAQVEMMRNQTPVQTGFMGERSERVQDLVDTQVDYLFDQLSQQG